MPTIQVVPQVTQASFDEVVKENMEEFEMGADEAVREAAEQFASQGVDLSNIIQRAPLNEDQPHPVMAVIEQFKTLVASETIDDDAMDAVATELVTLLKEKPVRLLVGESGFVAVLIAACERFGSHAMSGGSDSSLLSAVKVFVALVHGQPDLLGRVQSSCLEVAGGETAVPTPEILAVCNLITSHADRPAVQALAIKLSRFGCFMHESNRQAFVAAGFIEMCLAAAEKHTHNDDVVVCAMQALRALTRDDDPRVPFGKANDHATMICKDHSGLRRLLGVLHVCCDGDGTKPTVATELCKTLSQLATRDEFCKEIVELGCLDYILPALEKFTKTESVAHAGCSLLRAVSGNDEVKRIIGARGGIQLIVDVMQAQLRSEKVAEQGSAALAALALKTPTNATAIVAANGPHVIVKSMYMHPKAVKMQRQACMALRNTVVRNPEHIDAVLGEGAESALNICLEAHRDCQDEAKAALRDLKCKVELKERWTGEIKTENLDIDGTVREF